MTRHILPSTSSVHDATRSEESQARRKHRCCRCTQSLRNEARAGPPRSRCTAKWKIRQIPDHAPQCDAGGMPPVNSISLSNEPLVYVLQVFRHMEPLDLLHLARTSKALRAILMTRRHANVWKAACANVPGLPPCPDAVPVPLYASLLFCTFCHVRFLRHTLGHTSLRPMQGMREAEYEEDIVGHEDAVLQGVHSRTVGSLVPVVYFALIFGVPASTSGRSTGDLLQAHRFRT